MPQKMRTGGTKRTVMAVGMVGLAALPLPGRAAAQNGGSAGAGEALFDSAYFAWDRGDYITALEAVERLLHSTGGEAWLERIALLTGEPFVTTEVAADGTNLRWSADGTHFSYETGERDRATIHLMRVENGRAVEVEAFTGWDANFVTDGEALVYFRMPNHAALDEARVAEALATRAGDDEAVRRLRAQISVLEAQQRQVVRRSLLNGSESLVTAPGLEPYDLATIADGSTVLVGRTTEENDRYDLYLLRDGGEPVQLTRGPGVKGGVILPAGPDHLVYTIGTDSVALQAVTGAPARVFAGRSPAVSRDGSTMVFLRAAGGPPRTGPVSGSSLLASAATIEIVAVDVGRREEPRVVKETVLPVAGPALSPSGRVLAYTAVPRDDWEIFTVDLETGEEARLTRAAQHDLFPTFLSDSRLLAVMGEARHRRAHLHSIADDTGADAGEDQSPIPLFHNNTVRTVAPQYEWVPDPAGDRILIVADRDGDTLSPERGIYLVDLTRPVTLETVLERIARQLESERRLLAFATDAFAEIEEDVRAATTAVEVARIYEHARALYQFDTKYIGRPGNLLAIEYLRRELQAMGYEPELEWFEPRPGVRTANVIATLRGARRPEQINVISSHFDSVDRSPGADDNSSGTTALLEAARVLATRPQPETIRFAFLTGEEAGLLGSREHVRLARVRGDRIVSVLNNDMVGWSGDHRLDNTIRYSNDTIRDIEHSAAMLFTDLITYDARYVRSTDAQAFWDAYGDIIGGIGSYPILGNPHYHQEHDILETVNQQLVAEVAKTTVAAVMRLAHDDDI